METEGNDFTTVYIAQDGHVIPVHRGRNEEAQGLFFGPQSASRVLSGILGPRFNEGQGLDENELTDVDMSQEGAEAMEIMHNVFHGCNNAVNDGLDASQVLRVAITSYF